MAREVCSARSAAAATASVVAASAGAQATAGFGRRRYRSALVVAELALALILLTGAGLMIESVTRLLHVDPGFDPANLLRVNLELPHDKVHVKLKQKARGGITIVASA